MQVKFMKWVQKGKKKKTFFIEVFDDLGFDEKDLGKKKKGSKEKVC